MGSLLAGRASRFRLERLDGVVDRVLGLKADHILITGDLTTTAHSSEFREARRALAPLLNEPNRATVIPGNHDRYTAYSVRTRSFEAAFGEFSPGGAYPWIRPLDDRTAIIGLDATRSHLSAKGLLPAPQLESLKRLLAGWSGDRLIIASHYPVVAPVEYAAELARKRMINSEALIAVLKPIKPHLYCCGHVHAAWVFAPGELPNEICLNAGSPLLRDSSGHRSPGFLEIELNERDVAVRHHAWSGEGWTVRSMLLHPNFFG